MHPLLLHPRASNACIPCMGVAAEFDSQQGMGSYPLEPHLQKLLSCFTFSFTSAKLSWVGSCPGGTLPFIPLPSQRPLLKDANLYPSAFALAVTLNFWSSFSLQTVHIIISLCPMHSLSLLIHLRVVKNKHTTDSVLCCLQSASIK